MSAINASSGSSSSSSALLSDPSAVAAWISSFAGCSGLLASTVGFTSTAGFASVAGFVSTAGFASTTGCASAAPPVCAALLKSSSSISMASSSDSMGAVSVAAGRVSEPNVWPFGSGGALSSTLSLSLSLSSSSSSPPKNPFMGFTFFCLITACNGRVLTTGASTSKLLILFPGRSPAGLTPASALTGPSLFASTCGALLSAGTGFAAVCSGTVI
mmetsp:Transcript_11343/g.34722  ORF Transcript_11343/g.34722 Transcript_11343/m.34722 type:complete len:215 (+) Transcript_11343:2558-3202(+)